MASIVSAGTTSATALNMSADTTGILQLASNNGTVAITVMDTSKVGIGNTVPDLPLDVYGSAGLNGDANRIMVLQTNNTATAGYGGGIAFGGYYNGTTNRINDFAGIQGFKENGTAGDYAGALKFTTRVNGGSPTERMRISSAGYVTAPYQPMFSVYKTDGNVPGSVSGAGTTMVFNATLANVSSSYSTSTGRFTAPVAGTYYFSFMGMLQSTGSSADLQMIILKNGVAQSISNPATISGSIQGMGFACSCAITLAVSDYVNVGFYANIGASAVLYASGNVFNNFSGFLIG